MSSNGETYSTIRETLDALRAPPGETITERIRGLVGSAAAALHAAGIVVGDGTLAEAIGILAKERATDAAIVEQVIRERDERVRLAEARADRMDTQWAAAERRASDAEHREASVVRVRDQWQRRALAAEGASEQERARSVSATVANGKMLDDINDLRAATDRLQAQLDYATELHLAAMRARA